MLSSADEIVWTKAGLSFRLSRVRPIPGQLAHHRRAQDQSANYVGVLILSS